MQEQDEREWILGRPLTTNELVDILFRARLEQRLSQKELGKRMGIGQAALSQLELRQRIGSIETFQSWASALGYTLTLEHPRIGDK